MDCTIYVAKNKGADQLRGQFFVDMMHAIIINKSTSPEFKFMGPLWNIGSKIRHENTTFV